MLLYSWRFGVIMKIFGYIYIFFPEFWNAVSISTGTVLFWTLLFFEILNIQLLAVKIWSKAFGCKYPFGLGDVEDLGFFGYIYIYISQNTCLIHSFLGYLHLRKFCRMLIWTHKALKRRIPFLALPGNNLECLDVHWATERAALLLASRATDHYPNDAMWKGQFRRMQNACVLNMNTWWIHVWRCECNRMVLITNLHGMNDRFMLTHIYIFF